MRTLACLALVGCASNSTEVPGDSDAAANTADPANTDDPANTGDTDTDVDPTDQGVPMFIAQGHVGRTSISCDDGNTWVADQSNDDDLRCWSDNWEPDCDHSPDSARGIAYGDGVFMATFGWGYPGGLFRSVDGVRWDETYPGSSAAGMAYGNGVFIAGDWSPLRSVDAGLTWTRDDDFYVPYNVRRTSFVEAGGGRFLLLNDGPLLMSSDDGVSWYQPPAPAGCGTNVMFNGGAAYGNGALVIVAGDGPTCVSTDDGATFTAGAPVDVYGWLTSRLLFNGTEFVVWGNGLMYTSPDGQSWSETAVSGVELDAVAQSEDGTYVGVGGWYDGQNFYRSTDGVSWQAIGGYGGHPVFDLTFGIGQASPTCP